MRDYGELTARGRAGHLRALAVAARTHVDIVAAALQEPTADSEQARDHTGHR